MQNKKGGLRRSARIYMSRIERRAAEASGDAIQPSTFHSRCIFSPVPSLYFSPFLSFSLSRTGSRPADVRVFRARLRFRSLDAEERLIVAPFLPAVFTAWGNSTRRGITGKREARSISRTCMWYMSRPMNLLSLPELFASSRYPFRAYFLIRREEKRRTKPPAAPHTRSKTNTGF